ncbi:transposase [Pusillimonas sp. ANT_WB101]|nr:transposase [Pusillimonas sp. ANT_WB101]
MLVDSKSRKVLAVMLEHSESSLCRYVKRLRGREQVKVVVMDMSAKYRTPMRDCAAGNLLVCLGGTRTDQQRIVLQLEAMRLADN